MSGGSDRRGGAGGDFKAYFQSGIFSLLPHTEKNCHHWELALFLSSKRNAHVGNNANFAQGCMYMDVGVSIVTRTSTSVCSILASIDKLSVLHTKVFPTVIRLSWI